MVEVPKVPPSERYPGRPEEGRIVVIAPTRAACETIELGVGLTGVDTILEREHGEDVRRLAASGKGFGIMAGTGTGKTLAIRPIAQAIVGEELRVGVVNREREATPETPTWNVVIVTTGIARRWFQDDLIGPEDVIIVDEIHQTSAELELCLALGKRAGCRFIWLSATVDPTFYAEYLDSAEIIESSAFDPEKAATVRISNANDAKGFLTDRFLRHVVREKRGVAVFVPTRAETEQIAEAAAERAPRVEAVFYHGGEPVSKLRPFLEGDAPRPYVLSMTAAGQSALNVQGLDTVVIQDAQFTTIVKKGKNILTRLPLGSNEILQMAGRVHGRVAGGEVWILTSRDIDFGSLVPTEPNFQLAGDPERVALTCADMGVRADDLDLPVPLDRIAYRRAIETLATRGLIGDDGRLTEYGKRVEVLPVDRPWGELIVQAEEHMAPLVATCASIDSLHRMTRNERSIDQYVIAGSDHLTAYQIYEDALRTCGSLGQVYGLPRHVFDEATLEAWAEERGVLVRSIEDAALAVASIYRSLDLPLPRTLPRLNDDLKRDWERLIARVMPFDLVIDAETSWGEEVHSSLTSVCSDHGVIAGDLRYFADKFGRTRGSIEGTQLPFDLIWSMAGAGEQEIVYEADHRRAPLRKRTERAYHGFVLDSEEQGIDEFPPGLEDEARRVLAEAMAVGLAHHRDAKASRNVYRELREIYRRSGGTTREANEAALVDYYFEKLKDVSSYSEFLEADLSLDPDDWVPREERARYEALPDSVTLQGEEYPLDYALEGGEPIARARIPVKLLGELDEEDVPELDRPLHWTVLRGKRESIRAATLADARTQLLEPRPRSDSDDEESRARRRGQREREEERPRRGGGGGGRGGGGRKGGRPPAPRGRGRKGGKKGGRR